jgi:uncharacterized protein YndB with AHSA1/START domain
MPSFEFSAVSQAPPEEVWKLLYDPSRFPEWWAGMETVETDEPEDPGRRRFTYYAEGRPNPLLLDTSRSGRRVLVSCLVTDLRFEWRLEPANDGDATLINVFVDIPEDESQQLDTQRAAVSRSLARLAELAART